MLLLPGALGTGAGDFPTQLDPENGMAASGHFKLVAWDPPGYGKSVPNERTWPLDFFDRDAQSAADLINYGGGTF